MSNNEYKFSFQELLIGVLRSQHIHEGHWVLNVEFNVTGISMNTTESLGQTVPGLVVSMTRATLVRADHGAKGAIDAAVANPIQPVSGATPSRPKKSSSITLQ
ncbi:hypothetical protein [Paraburkholderia sp. EG304]|uniref:hypothetical protein n=1 Tax=Paraburkholderia sp. EG304 TaxID=3237015 RepID=UPI00397B4002